MSLRLTATWLRSPSTPYSCLTDVLFRSPRKTLLVFPSLRHLVEVTLGTAMFHRTSAECQTEMERGEEPADLGLSFVATLLRRDLPQKAACVCVEPSLARRRRHGRYWNVCSMSASRGLPLLLGSRNNSGRSRRNPQGPLAPTQLMSSGSDFPSFGFFGCGAQGHLNEYNANELLRKLYRIGKGQQAAVILGEYSGNVAHARTDAGGVSEIQRLCRHHGAVRGDYTGHSMRRTPPTDRSSWSDRFEGVPAAEHHMRAKR